MKRYKQLFKESYYEYGYHVTEKLYLESIKTNGLLINSVDNLILEGKQFNEFYGCKPIYIAIKKTKEFINYINELTDPVILTIKLDNYELVADIPSLVDRGLVFESDFSQGYIENTNIDYDDLYVLLNSNSYETKNAINLTKTAAILQNISPKDIIFPE